jgi:hypothetical protein
MFSIEYPVAMFTLTRLNAETGKQEDLLGHYPVVDYNTVSLQEFCKESGWTPQNWKDFMGDDTVQSLCLSEISVAEWILYGFSRGAVRSYQSLTDDLEKSGLSGEFQSDRLHLKFAIAHSDLQYLEWSTKWGMALIETAPVEVLEDKPALAGKPTLADWLSGFKIGPSDLPRE